ncbi:hypothetical protein ACSBQT_06230 [Brevibacterium sp. H602]|uniref:hypothetical protein n=1 Tax=unclassified Brevibacterium TaxID=2614124 RepID=UPI00397A13C4
MVTAIIAALFMLIPLGATTAYLTAKDSADETTGGVGRWCSVPNPADHPNVYRLKDFPTYSSSSSSMIIVPVVRNGEFGAGGGDGRLGVRAWACDSSSLTTGSTIKVTSWRNTSSSPTLDWLAPVGGNGLASRRLNPDSGLGKEVTKLHRHGSTALGDAEVILNDRQRYSWIMSSNRNKNSRDASPPCSLSLCTVSIEKPPTFADGFTGDATGTREPKNSVEYLASGYWVNGGDFDKSAPHPVNLTQYGNDIASTDGRQVQWVVMEWWGSTTPTKDMVLEVFVQ